MAPIHSLFTFGEEPALSRCRRTFAADPSPVAPNVALCSELLTGVVNRFALTTSELDITIDITIDDALEAVTIAVRASGPSRLARTSE